VLPPVAGQPSREIRWGPPSPLVLSPSSESHRRSRTPSPKFEEGSPQSSQVEQNGFTTSLRCRRSKSRQEPSPGAAGPWSSSEPYGTTVPVLSATTPSTDPVSRGALHRLSRIGHPRLDLGIPLHRFNLGRSSRSKHPRLDQVS
jgi:hypothetical protein